MKKIVYQHNGRLVAMLDSKDYIKIEKYNQNISDKYVNLWGNKISGHKGVRALKKGDFVIRKFYYICFGYYDISVYFMKLKCYGIYRNGEEYTPELNLGIKSKNSTLDFDDIKDRIVRVFSKDVKIEKL